MYVKLGGIPMMYHWKDSVLSFLFMVSASCGFWITDLEIFKPDLRNSCPVFDELPAFLQNQPPGHQGFERVVVFVYRAIGTNQLITFIPSSQYQKCISSYPDTQGEKVFNVNTITIEDLLQSNYNKPQPVTEDNIPQPKIPEASSVHNAWNDLFNDMVAIENNQHNVNVNIPVRPEIPGIHISSTTDNKNQGGVMNVEINKPAENWNNWNPIDGNAYPLPSTFPEQWSNQEQVTNSEFLNQVPNLDQIVSTGPVTFPKDVPGDGKITFPSDTISTETKLPSSQQSIHLEPTLEQHIITSQPPINHWGLEYAKDIPQPGHVNHLHGNYGIPPGSLQNVGIPRPSYDEGYLVSPNSWSSIVSQPVPNYQPPSNLFSQWQLVKVPGRNPVNNQFNSYSWAMNSKFNHMTNQKYPPQKGAFKFPLTAAESPKPSYYGSTFDSWFMTEWRVIKSSGQGMSSSAADINFVRRRIEEALRYHGYTVTINGLLVDENGVASSLSNLKLRPLLIGTSFEYNNLLSGVQGGTYKRPVTPMIEGILLSLINPPKILGILTLGLTWAGHENGQVQGHSQWRLPEASNFLSAKGEVKNALLRNLKQNILGGIRGLNLGGSYNITGRPLHISPVILNRIIGGSSATGTGTPLASKG